MKQTHKKKKRKILQQKPRRWCNSSTAYDDTSDEPPPPRGVAIEAFKAAADVRDSLLLEHSWVEGVVPETDLGAVQWFTITAGWHHSGWRDA